MKTYKLKITVAFLSFLIGFSIVWLIDGFSYLAHLVDGRTETSEVSPQIEETSRVLNSSEDKSISPKKQTYPFADYPVAEIYKGKNAPLKFTRQERLDYGERYKILETAEPNFAGHYIVATWNCGMWCQYSDIIDAKTGKLYAWKGILSYCFPDLDTDFACNEDFSNVEYRANSKLIIFFGSLSYGKKRGFHYYKFENGKLIHLKSVLVKEQRSTSEIMIARFDGKENK